MYAQAATPATIPLWSIDADQHVITRHMSRRVFELSWAVWVRLRKSRDGAATSTPSGTTRPNTTRNWFHGCRIIAQLPQQENNGRKKGKSTDLFYAAIATMCQRLRLQLKLTSFKPRLCLENITARQSRYCAFRFDFDVATLS